METRTVDAIRDGYSFLSIGELYQTAIEINVEACRRFGADKAKGVISTVLYDADKSPEYITAELKEEEGITITAHDLEFLGKVVRAKQLIGEALKLLQEA